jgi:hypothetical protein
MLKALFCWRPSLLNLGSKPVAFLCQLDCFRVYINNLLLQTANLLAETNNTPRRPLKWVVSARGLCVEGGALPESAPLLTRRQRVLRVIREVLVIIIVASVIRGNVSLAE